VYCSVQWYNARWQIHFLFFSLSRITSKLRELALKEPPFRLVVKVMEREIYIWSFFFFFSLFFPIFFSPEPFFPSYLLVFLSGLNFIEMKGSLLYFGKGNILQEGRSKSLDFR
jgi:hypothetical protein